jgi:hypothetical protein
MIAKARMLFLALLLAGVGVSAVNVATGPLPVSAASAQSRDHGSHDHGSGDHKGGSNDHRGGDRQGGDRQRS